MLNVMFTVSDMVAFCALVFRGIKRRDVEAFLSRKVQQLVDAASKSFTRSIYPLWQLITLVASHPTTVSKISNTCSGRSNGMGFAMQQGSVTLLFARNSSLSRPIPTSLGVLGIPRARNTTSRASAASLEYCSKPGCQTSRSAS
jgi:hypothetical protein